MLRRAFLFIAVVALAAFPLRATADNRVLVQWSVINRSDTCPWITAYWSYESEAHWRIVGGKGRPNWLARNGSLPGFESFNHPPLTPQVRWRAEIPSPGDAKCHGSGGKSVWAQRNFTKQGRIDMATLYRGAVIFEGSQATGYRLVIGNFTTGV